MVAEELKKHDRNIAVRIVGSQLDKRYLRELQDEVKKRDLAGVVTFVDGVEQTELVEEYRNASVLMNPSDTDGLDKVILEAMAMGCIPVTANLACKELLSPHGLFMQKGDIDGYATAIEKVFAMPEEEHRSLQKILREIVLQDHAIETLPKRIFNVA
jgi:glycosyltransferase involved in cell wall biosynthesis